MNPQAGFAAHVAALGQGPRRALALHCTLAFGGAWAGLARVLGDQLTLVAPDMPSHGQSPDWDGQSDFSDSVFAMAEAALDPGPMDVIGHSFGAATALRLALAHPDRVRSLTLIEPVLFFIALTDAPETMVDHDARAAPFSEAMERGDQALGARLFNRMWSARGTWDKMPERARAAMIRAIPVVPDTRRFLFDDCYGLMAPGVLAGLDLPCLLIRGSNSLPAITAVNDGLALRLPQAEQAVIEGAGHMAPITHPAETAAAINALLARS